MKFKIVKTAGSPGYGSNIRLNVWIGFIDDETNEPTGYWEQLNIDFGSIESARDYAARYKSESYEEEFEL